jgi:hypothetical protein
MGEMHPLPRPNYSITPLIRYLQVLPSPPFQLGSTLIQLDPRRVIKLQPRLRISGPPLVGLSKFFIMPDYA